MPINTVKVYYNLALILYIKGSILKVVVAISIISTTVNKWLKVLLASSMLIEVALLSIKSLKAIKQVIEGCFGSFKLSLDLIFIIRVSKILLKFFKSLLSSFL